VCLLNPLVRDALYWGHPEEILTASLMVGSLLAACERRVVLTAVLAGLAVASKQWAVIAVAPALLVLGRERLRAAVLMGSTAVVATLPMVVGNFDAFRHAIRYISSPQPVMTSLTWLYPFSPTGTVRVTNIFGDDRTFIGHRVWPIESAVSHPLIIVLGLAIPVLVWWRRRGGPAADAMLAATAVVFVLRCVLDPGTTAYYHLPLLLILVLIDVAHGRRVPVAGLAGGAVSFVVLDRFPGYLGAGAANLLYIAATAIAIGLLTRQLRTAPARPAGIEVGELAQVAA
jgi:glycosyl transferase family 87